MYPTSYTFCFRVMQEVVSFFSLYTHVIYHTHVFFIVILIGKGNNKPSLRLILVSYVCIFVCMYV